MQTAVEKKMTRRRLMHAHLSTVLSISLVLVLVGLASLLLLSAGSVADYFKENMQVGVILKNDVSDADARAFIDELGKTDFVIGTRYISREEGTKELESMLGEDFLSIFETSPVPASIDLTLEAAYVSADSLKMVERYLMRSPLVDEVSYRESLIEALNQNIRKIALALSIAVALLLFISFALISNTMRLSVHARRFTVHTMRLVGATKGFIMRPFLLQAVVQGLVSSLVAVLLLLAGYFLAGREFAGLADVFPAKVLALTALVVFAAGVVICVLSTWIVVGRLVSLGKDELYY